MVFNCEKVTDDGKEQAYSLAEVLEDYAVGVRYPSDDFEPTYDDAKETFNTAKKLKLIFEQKIADIENQKALKDTENNNT